MSKGPAKQFKSDRYSAKDDSDELELITDKLALDLRKSIRQLVSFNSELCICQVYYYATRYYTLD
jgi:hypothetical protein